MNAPAFVSPLSVRAASLAYADDRLRVEQYLEGHEGTTLFHLPKWAEAVERGCGHKTHYLVTGRPDGRIVGVLPLTEIRSRLFGSALVSSGFGVGGGILADHAQAVDMLAGAAWTLAETLGCPQVELRGGALPSPFARGEGVYASFVRDLPAGEDDILKAIPRKQRAEVRRALGFGMDVDVGRGPDRLAAHYGIYAESVRNLGTPVFPRALFEAMLGGFGDDADILTVRKDGEAVASVLSFYFRGTVYPYWGGGTLAARSLRANELLYFGLMRHAAGRGCTRFDFGRSKIGTGAFAYKKNWGFEPEPLVYGLRTAAGAAPRSVNPLDARYRLQVALWRRLPLFIANRLGPHIARGLG